MTKPMGEKCMATFGSINRIMTMPVFQYHYPIQATIQSYTLRPSIFQHQDGQHVAAQEPWETIYVLNLLILAAQTGKALGD